MKINKNFVIKDKLTIGEYLNFVDNLASSYFDTSDGIDYRPEYATILRDAITLINCTDAIEFDDSEADNIFFEVAKKMQEKEFSSIKQDVVKVEFKTYYSNALEDTSLRVEHIKDQIVHKQDFSVIETKMLELLAKESEKLDMEIKENKYNDKLVKAQLEQIEYANKVAEYVTPEEQAEITRKMADSNFDLEKVGEIIADKFFKSSEHDANIKDIIESKNAEIKDLKKYKKAHDARNVLSENK